jgi:hypothetical protein
MKVPISVRTSYSKADLRCLVDSGATDNFIHPRFLRRMGLGTRKLTNPKRLYNVDDTTNRAGQVTDYVDLDVRTNNIHKEMRFLVSDIGREDAILGYPWLATFEPPLQLEAWRHQYQSPSHRSQQRQPPPYPTGRNDRRITHRRQAGDTGRIGTRLYRPRSVYGTGHPCTTKEGSNATSRIPTFRIGVQRGRITTFSRRAGPGTTLSLSKAMPLRPSTVRYTP